MASKIRPHNFGDKLLPTESLVTVYFIDSELKSAEEMDFLIVPGVSEADIKDYARAWAKDELDPTQWDTMKIGMPSCGVVRH